MAKAYKRLGAVTVVANTDTTLYTCPTSTTTITSCIFVSNRGASERTFRIAIVDGAIGSVSSSDYLYYDAVIAANSGQSFNIGVILQTTYTILVRASHADVNFLAFGAEIT